MEEPPATRDSRQARVVAGALLVIPALAFWFGFGERFRTPKLLAGELLSVVALAWVTFGSRRRGPAARWSAVAWDLPVLAALVSLYAMTGHGLTGWRDVGRLAALAAAYTVIRSAGDPWRLAPVVGVAMAVNAGLAILQSAGMGLWVTAREGRHAVYGTFGNPNLLGEWLAVAIPMIAVAASRSASRAGRIGGGWVVGLGLVAVLATGARAAALGLAMASPILALALSPGGGGMDAARRRIAVWSMTGLALLIAAGVFIMRRPDPGAAPAVDPTRATRALMRDVARDLCGERPWTGIGPGQYGLRFLAGAAKRLAGATTPPIYAGTTMEAHCEPAQALAERGLLGAGGWIAGLALAVGLVRKRTIAGDARFLESFAACIVMAVCAALGFPFHVFPTALLFLWVVVALADDGSPAPDVGPRPGLLVWARVRALAYLALIPLAGRDALAQAALAVNTEPALRMAARVVPGDGEVRFRLALDLRAAGRIAESEPEFTAALPGNPDPDIRFNLGWIALQRKEYQSAADRFAEGLRLYPFFRSPAWADYALALHGLKRDAEARVAAERALAIDPGMARARALLDDLNRPGRKGSRR